MTDVNKLYSGITKTAWGYFFIYFNININTISILPSFLGYFLFLSAIELLKDEERELSLLHTMGSVLVLWHTADWIAGFMGLSVNEIGQFANIVISLINMYFHFQLLTNVANIAKKYQQDNSGHDAKLLRYRTVQTVMLTIVSVIDALRPWRSEFWGVISVFLMIIYLIVGVALMKVLFDFRKSITTVETQSDSAE